MQLLKGYSPNEAANMDRNNQESTDKLFFSQRHKPIFVTYLSKMYIAGRFRNHKKKANEILRYGSSRYNGYNVADIEKQPITKINLGLSSIMTTSFP